MVKRVVDANLGSKEGRRKLDFSDGKPRWREIGSGLHLGYRRGKRATGPNAVGKWVVRVYTGDGVYKTATIATADDAEPPAAETPRFLELDRNTILSFAQAQDVCWEIKRGRLLEDTTDATDGSPYTVNKAIDDYLAWLRHNGQPTEDTASRADFHIRPSLGDKPVARLTTPELRDWLTGVVGDVEDEERRRKRQATANRTLTILKAALNHGWREGKVDSDSAWRRVKPFRDVGAARVRYLSIAECQRLLNAASGDFRDLLHGALQTGARYGELAAMKVGDVNFDVGTVHVPKSKSGKARDIILTDEGVATFR